MSREMVQREPRKNFMLSATIESRNVSAPVRIRNMSVHGAMIEGGALPDPGSTVVLSRVEMSVGATVIWKRDMRCGIHLDRRIVIEDWVKGTPSGQFPPGPSQTQVDASLEALREGAPIEVEPVAAVAAIEPVPPLAAEPLGTVPIDVRIAAELDLVKAMLEEAGEKLASDMDIVMKHEKSIQNIDIASAITGQLSEIVASENSEKAIDAIFMHDMKERMTAGRGPAG